MARVLLINPSYLGSYGGAKASIVNPIYPTLGLATTAAMALKHGHKVKILDLSMKPYHAQEVKQAIIDWQADIVGITGTTPLINQMRDISVLVKDISKNIITVGGGPHVTTLPEYTLNESLLDVVIIGEGDYSFPEICDGKAFKDIKGICYRDGENFIKTAPRTFEMDLDNLPFPAWELYDLSMYKKLTSRLYAKSVPFVTAEFSRGCIYKCNFCASKMTLGLGYRRKTPKRCAEEVKHMASLGIKGFTLTDDIFTSDNRWAITVCEEIKKTGVKLDWACSNGIRVESVNEELFKALKEAGCYRVSFGLETGSDKILKSFGKGGKASIEQGEKAVTMAQKAGLDVCGFFLLGLSEDTEETMNETIDFAKKLPLDMLKFGITIAFPGTPMFNEYLKAGLINTTDWDRYHMYSGYDLFAHKNLSNDMIRKYMKTAYHKAILFNFRFILRRVIHGFRSGEFFWDFYYFLKFLFMPEVGKDIAINYYAPSRWPTNKDQRYLQDIPLSRMAGSKISHEKTTVGV